MSKPELLDVVTTFHGRGVVVEIDEGTERNVVLGRPTELVYDGMFVADDGRTYPFRFVTWLHVNK